MFARPADIFLDWIFRNACKLCLFLALANKSPSDLGDGKPSSALIKMFLVPSLPYLLAHMILSLSLMVYGKSYGSFTWRSVVADLLRLSIRVSEAYSAQVYTEPSHLWHFSADGRDNCHMKIGRHSSVTLYSMISTNTNFSLCPSAISITDAIAWFSIPSDLAGCAGFASLDVGGWLKLLLAFLLTLI